MFSHLVSSLCRLLGRISRVLAVIALALSPVWGFPTVHAASSSAPSRFPYWPGFFSSGCNAVTQSFGGVVIACGTGGYVETQITSAYGGCSEIDIDVTGFGSGPFITTATAPVGGLQNTITINDNGHYYMQLNWVPSTIVGPIAIQLTAPDTGNISIQNITVSPCPVPTSTPTVNPSSTSTNTPVPVTGTPTPIPSNTPLPSGHNTFTPTITTTPVPGTSTATPSITPFPGLYNCGEPSFPLLNCGMGPVAPFATFGSPWYGTPGCFNNGVTDQYQIYTQLFVYGTAICKQDVVAHASGNVFMTFDYSLGSGEGGNSIFFGLSGISSITNNFSGQGPGGLGQVATINMGSVTAGSTYTWFMTTASADGWHSVVHISDVWVGPPSGGSPVPTASSTTTATIAPATLTAVAASTLTAVAGSFTPTPVPIPGAPETPIPTSTECPGSCVQAELTQVPGVATRFTVDTSPFSAFTSLSVARSSCAPFGFVQIPYPVIHGTPALGSTNPLSITWTIPATSTWDDTHPFSNTAIQPCAMTNEIPSFVWDMTYWLSVFFIAVTYLFWLLGYVGRLSGEETING